MLLRFSSKPNTRRARSYGYDLMIVDNIHCDTDLKKLLHCGNIEADEGWFLRGGGTSTASNPNPGVTRRKGVIISVLIEHPTEGLVLFETGGGENYPEVWGVSR